MVGGLKFGRRGNAALPSINSVGQSCRFAHLTLSFKLRGAEKLVLFRDEAVLFQRDAEVSGLLVSDDRARVAIGFQKLPDHFVERLRVRWLRRKDVKNTVSAHRARRKQQTIRRC